jgi:outer membrane immunogenic protein
LGTTTNAATTTLPLFDAVALVANSFDPPHVVAGGLINGGTALANTGIANVNQNGFIGGGQIGYNYQWGPSFLVGLEADIQGAAIRGSRGYVGTSRDSVQWNDGPGIHPCGPVVNCIFNRTAFGAGQVAGGIDWMGTVRGRLGYLLTPTLLVYGTGGLAYGGGVHASAIHRTMIQGTVSNLNPPFNVFNGAVALVTVPGAGNFSDTAVGWTAGAGVEWMFLPNWSLKAEALYYDLGTVALASSPLIGIAPIGIAAGPLAVNADQVLIASNPATHIKFDGVIARAGINYHFNWGAFPIVAKY